MDISQIELQLEEIGLNQSEIKVYLSLLKLGSSSTGPIINESKTANSKVYEVLEKLIQKGLVSYFTKENVKHYKATNPKMILNFLNEKKKEIEQQEKKVNELLPSLLAFSQEKEDEKESFIFSGYRGIRTAFTNLVDELNNGDEVHIMGVYDFGKEFLPLALYFQKIRSDKKIKAKFLINDHAKNLAKEFKRYPPVEIKFMPENMLTPAIFLIYSDKVIINLAKEMTFFVLKSRNAKEAFEAYFQMMWKLAKK
ncbi:MAG: helix-turn-helix domain-containing protein [Candidatus Nanoarchaeia archaeon]|nr:helix-turn-helix domain-containing protein [Candidatus Nanoarchaeia archaeon]MDD5741163.1 helix-turn-helix domain-containing protein [Candidatus Nanoarchaeia archaeon]